MSLRRVPRLAAVAWGLAAVAIAGLVAAVWSYLAGDGMHMPGMHMPGMHMHESGSRATQALTRGAASSPTEPFSSAIVTAWRLDAVAVAVLVLLAAAYLTGVALVPVRSPGARWPVRHTVSFLVGLAICAIATNGSIAVYDQVLFSAHMAGHLALVMIAPAFLAWGRPLRLLVITSPGPRRERLERVLRGRVVSVLTAPPVVLATYAVVIVGSHLTGLMDTIMRNTWAGQVEHLVYLLAGLQFFVLIVGDEPIRWRLGAPARFLLLALAMAVDTFTGIVLMQGTSAVGLLPSVLDVNALSDTRTGGAIMWVGGDAIMGVVMLGLAFGWLRHVESAPAERGWLEQARSATFTAHTGASTDTDDTIDADDAARTAYNDWLASLERR